MVRLADGCQPDLARGAGSAMPLARAGGSGPVLWVLVDLIVTGKPFYSLNSTAGLAQELGRTQGLASVIGSVWTFGVRIDKLPVLLGAFAGLGLAIWLTPRRVLCRWRRSCCCLAVSSSRAPAGPR